MEFRGQNFPDQIRTNRIISAFVNEGVWNKVERYAREMKGMDIETGHHGFPPIHGYPVIIDEDMIGEEFLSSPDSTGDMEITEDMIGEVAFYVTDGHHRCYAAIMAGINFFEYEIDPSITQSWNLSQ